ncbi:MAG: Crp/Fnr family transcriptional regulator [Dehalococcoidia bacterium]|nr:Crp/Fnr family transcriptional regulator [Dehalococcoidia bacterium]
MESPHAPGMAEQLGAAPLFQGLDSETLALLASGSTRRRYTAGATVFKEGDTPDGLYVVESGWVRAVKMSPQGREQVLQFIGPGEPFNTVALFSRSNPATAMALEESVVRVVSLATIERLLAERPQFARRILENMADRLIYLVGLVADLSLRPVMGRLARLIVDQAQDGVLARPKWFTFAELAARLGTVPDVIQRAMGALQAEGAIDVNRREIRVLDEEKLRELAEG